MNSFKFLQYLRFIFFVLILVQVQANSTSQHTEIVVRDLIFVNDIGEVLEDNLFTKNFLTQENTIFDISDLMKDMEVLNKNFNSQYPNIEMQLLPIGEGEISIKFELQKNRIVEQLSITGSEDNPTDLRNELSIKMGSVLKGSLVKEDLESIKNYYLNNGYPFVQVDLDLDLLPNENVNVNYKILLNSKKLHLNKINFKGKKSFKSKKLKALMSLKEKSFFNKKEVIKNSKIIDDIKKLKDYYTSHGFMNIQIDFEIVSLAKKKELANLEITIKEGSQSLIKEVNITGNDKITSEVLHRVLKFKTPAPFNLKQQKRALKSVRDYYGERGYSLSQVQMHYDNETQELKLQIIEGKKQSILLIEVIGNNNVKKKHVIEKLTFSHGEVVNTRKIEKSLDKLYKSGLFRDVKIDYIPITETEGKMVIQVQETSTRVLQFSIGSVDGNAGFGTSVNDQNIFGSGSSLSASGMISKELQRLNLIYKDPNLFGSQNELNIQLSHDKADNHYYSHLKSSIKLMIERKITENIKLGLGTRLEYINPKKIAQAYANQTLDLSMDEVFITGLVSTFAYAFNKTEGKTITSGGKVSLIMMPSYSEQKYFFKAVSNLEYFKNFGQNESGNKHQISARMTLGYVSKRSPYQERLLGGGIGTIRGFSHKSINKNGTKLGANSSLALNTTYSFPIYDNILSGVFFLDAFALGDEKLNLDEFRVVGGLGLRAHMNTGLLAESFEAGITIPLLKKDGDITTPFYFTFGEYDPAYNL